jgi:hypothetical protein
MQEEIHDPITVDLYVGFFFSMRVSDKLEHIFPCKVCNENKPTGLKTNVLENVQSILDGRRGGGGRGSTNEKNFGVGIQIIQLLRNNQSKCITYKYDLWKIIIINNNNNNMQYV